MRQNSSIPKTKADKIWSTDNGREPWQYTTIRALDASRGNALALVPRSDTILMANFRYLLRVNTQTGREELLRISLHDPKYAPVIELGTKERLAQTSACFTGLAYYANKIYALVETYKSDILLVLDDKGEVLQSHPIGQPDVVLPYLNERSQRVFPSVKQELVRLRFLPPDSLFAFASEYRRTEVNKPHTAVAGSLLQYTQRSPGWRLNRQWRSITGYAISSAGEVFVSGSPLFRLGVQVTTPPPKLDPHHWSLIGVDNKGLLYWRSLRLVREQVRGKSIAVPFTRVACSDKEGHLLWQLELDGSHGVLARIDPHLTTYAGGWLEVADDGILWVLALHLDNQRKKDTVGLYRIQVMA